MSEETLMDKVEEVVENVAEVAEKVDAVVEKSQELGIKETQEAMKALELLVETAGKIFADGKIDGSDLLHAVDMIKKLEVFMDGFKDAKQIGAEVKDLSETELIVLGTEAYKLVRKTIEVIKQAKK